MCIGWTVHVHFAYAYAHGVGVAVGKPIAPILLSLQVLERTSFAARKMAAWNSPHGACRCSHRTMVWTLTGVLVILFMVSLLQLYSPSDTDENDAKQYLEAASTPGTRRSQSFVDQLLVRRFFQSAKPQTVLHLAATPTAALPIAKPNPFARSPPRCPAQAAWPVDPTDGSMMDPSTGKPPLHQLHSGFGVPPGRKIEFGRVASSYAMAMLPMPFWQRRDEYDHHSMSVDLNWVSFSEGRMTLHGLQDWTVSEHKNLQWMPEYKHFRLGLEYSPQRPDQWTTLNAPLDLSSCTEIVHESTMFLSGWLWSSIFNSWNDNISPMFSHLRSLGLLDPATPKRLYLWPADDAHKSNWTREHLELLFNGNVLDFEQHLKKEGSKVCFRHVRWGRGPLEGYMRDVSPFSHSCTNLDHLWPIGGSAQHTDSEVVKDPLVSDSTVDGRTHDLRIRYLHQQSILSGDVIAWQLHVLQHYGIGREIRPNRLDTGERLDFLSARQKNLKYKHSQKQAQAPHSRTGQLQRVDPAPFDPNSSSDGPVIPNEKGLRKFRMMQEEKAQAIREGQQIGLNHTAAGSSGDLSASSLASCQHMQSHPRILFLEPLQANEKARIENARDIIDIAKQKFGLDVKRCCDWSLPQGPFSTHLRLLQSTDILIGASSAAFTSMIYMPPGALVVELQSEAHLHQPVYNRLTRWLDHAHLEIDIRSHMSPSEITVLPRDFIENTWQYVLDHWKRQQPCTYQENVARQRYYNDKTRAHGDRFPLANVNNMRSQNLHWSLQED